MESEVANIDGFTVVGSVALYQLEGLLVLSMLSE